MTIGPPEAAWRPPRTVQTRSRKYDNSRSAKGASSILKADVTGETRAARANLQEQARVLRLLHLAPPLISKTRRALPAAPPSHADRRQYKLQCLMAGCLIGSLEGCKEFGAFVLGCAGEGLMATTHGRAYKSTPQLRTRSAAESPQPDGYCAWSQSR